MRLLYAGVVILLLGIIGLVGYGPIKKMASKDKWSSMLASVGLGEKTLLPGAVESPPPPPPPPPPVKTAFAKLPGVSVSAVRNGRVIMIFAANISLEVPEGEEGTDQNNLLIVYRPAIQNAVMEFLNKYFDLYPESAPLINEDVYVKERLKERINAVLPEPLVHSVVFEAVSVRQP
jgi:hypothetical protein